MEEKKLWGKCKEYFNKILDQVIVKKMHSLSSDEGRIIYHNGDTSIYRGNIKNVKNIKKFKQNIKYGEYKICWRNLRLGLCKLRGEKNIFWIDEKSLC